jgi:hypothetical protein
MEIIRPKCGIKNCNKSHYAKGYCQAHYNRIHQRGKLNVHMPIGKTFNPQKRGLCSVVGCKNKHYAKKLCQTHYVEVRRTSTVTEDQRGCSVKGCNFVHYGHNLCFIHYELVRYQGKALKIKITSDFDSEAS